MNRIFAALSLICTTLLLTNCKSDDGGPKGEEVIIREPEEVYKENKASIAEYLANNYMIENQDGTISFDSITSPNYRQQPTIKNDPRLDSVQLTNDKYIIKTVTSQVYNPNYGIYENKVTRLEYTKNEDETKYMVYFLVLNEGKGVQPQPIDSVYTRNNIFNLKNESVTQPLKGRFTSFPETIVEYQSGFSTPQLTSGERQLLQFTKTAINLELGNDGLTYEEGSAGRIVAFIPSGLYLFNQSNSAKLKGYESAIVDMTVINTLERDHDLDGILSKYEVEPSKIGTKLSIEDYFSYSTSGYEDTPNFLNLDDDDDGVPTRTELIYYDEYGLSKYYKYNDPNLKLCSDKPTYLDKECRPYINEEGLWVWEKLDMKPNNPRN
ncbi:hypothetical protein ACYSNX_12325 [Myroides sp. LJL115]